MNKVAILMTATRPKTLIASLSPVCIGTSIAYYYGYFEFLIFFSCILTGLFIQIGTNLANDYFDFKKGADTSERIGPKRVMQSGLMSPQEMQISIVIAFILASIFCSYLIMIGGTPIALLLTIAILLGIGYTAGPFPLAYLGLGDLFVIVFFGMIATAATTYLFMGRFYIESLLIGLSPGFLSTSLLAINNLRDINTDRKANKKTLPVRFGEKFGKFEYCFMIIAAHIIPIFLYLYFEYRIEILYCLATLIPAVPLMKKVIKIKHSHEYNEIFPKTSLIIILFTLFFCISLIII